MKNDYLNDLKEFQEKQMLPGYYTGGKMPLPVKYPTRALGWFFLLMSVPFIVLMIVSGDFRLDWGSAAPLLFVLLYLIIGIKLVTRRRAK